MFSLKNGDDEAIEHWNKIKNNKKLSSTLIAMSAFCNTFNDTDDNYSREFGVIDAESPEFKAKAAKVKIPTAKQIQLNKKQLAKIKNIGKKHSGGKK